MHAPPERIVFLGPPGAGKGTHARWLAGSRGLLHVSTGNMLRAAVSEGTPLGRQARVYMEAGDLVPDALMIDMLFEHIADGGWILDGFPRTVPQAEALDDRLRSGGAELDTVLLFDAPRDELVERLTSRLTCSECDAIYNRRVKPPRTDGVCDGCGGKIVTRPDDRLEAVTERLEVYDHSTAPLIDYYENAGKLLRVGAAAPIPEIRARIAALLACDA